MMYNLVSLTLEWNKKLLISIMLPSNTIKGHIMYYDIQNSSGIVKQRDSL